MILPQSPALLAILAPFLLIAIFIQRYYVSRPPKGTRELPGPPGYPIIGNLLEFPKSHGWLTFREWGERYGPIYKVKVFGVTSVVINDPQITEQLLSVRGANYSERGAFRMLNMMTGGMDLLINPFNEYWRRGRKFATAVTNATMADQWRTIQAREAQRMVIDMIRDPSHYQFWLERFSTCVSVRQGFGKDLNASDEAEWHTNKILTRQRNLEKLGTPGRYLVETVPLLMYLPEWLAPFKREARLLHESELAYFTSLFQEAVENFQQGVPEDPPSFARTWMQKKDHYDLNSKEATYVIATLYGGGAGTTSVTMQSYFLAMCHFPQWQDQLHDELERVVGPDRVPGFDDFAQLTLVRAVSKELLRWRPILPSGAPHSVTKDDVYEGYHIPKGALVFGNQWGIHHDESLYPDPDQFRPDRFLDPKFPTYKEPNEQQPTIRRFSAFGAGRRICPGYEIAERALYIQIATLAWACRVSKKVVDGKEVPVPWYDYTDGATSGPKQFDFDVKAYDGKRVAMLKEDWEAAIY